MDINNLSGHEFEDLIEKLIRKMGFVIEERKKSFDGGIDLKATNETPILKGLYIIQCKRYQKPIGESIIRDLYGVVSSERANKGILITNSSFTRSAKSFALNKPIELIDGVLLQQLIKQYFGEENTTKGKRINIPQKYQIFSDSVENILVEYEKRHEEIISEKKKIDLRTCEDNISFLAYCKNKAESVAELSGRFINQFNGIISILNILPETELDYIEANQLKTKVGYLSLTLDDVEKEWIDALSILPPDNCRSLHKSLVKVYESFYEALTCLSDSLSSFIKDPVDYLSKTDRGELDKEKPTVRLTYLLTDKYVNVFAAEMEVCLQELRKEKLQKNIFYVFYKKLFPYKNK